MAATPPNNDYMALALVAARYETDVVAFAVDHDDQANTFDIAAVTVPTVGAPYSSHHQVRQGDRYTWAAVEQAIAPWSDALMITMWPETQASRLAAAAESAGRPAPTFGIVEDINHWSGPTRAIIRTQVPELYRAYFPEAPYPGSDSECRAAAVAAIANELVFTHGAQITGLSGEKRANASQHKVNTKVLALRIRREIQDHGFAGVQQLVDALRITHKAAERALYHGVMAKVVPWQPILEASESRAIQRHLPPRTRAQAEDTRVLVAEVGQAMRSDGKAAPPAALIALNIEALRAGVSPRHSGQSTLDL